MKMQAYSGATRRQVVKLVTGGIVLIPTLYLSSCAEENKPTSENNENQPDNDSTPAEDGSPPEQAEKDIEKLDENDPEAAALGYRHDARQVDIDKFPRRAEEGGEDQFCHNCALFQGKEGDTWAPCVNYAGKLVNAEGWCNAWGPKETLA